MPSLVKLVQWFCRRRRFFKFSQCISQFHNYLPFPWKMVGPFIWTNLNPLHPRMLCAKFGWNLPSRWKCEKFMMTTTMTTTDNGKTLIRKAHVSPQLRWANNTVDVLVNMTVWHNEIFKYLPHANYWISLNIPPPF